MKISRNVLMVDDWANIKDFPMRFEPMKFTENYQLRSLCEFESLDLTGDVLLANDFINPEDENNDIPYEEIKKHYFTKELYNDLGYFVLCSVWLDGSSTVISIYYDERTEVEEYPEKWSKEAVFIVPVIDGSVHMFQQALRVVGLSQFANHLLYKKL